MTELYHNLEISTSGQYKMDNSILILSTYMVKSTRMKKDKSHSLNKDTRVPVLGGCVQKKLLYE